MTNNNNNNNNNNQLIMPLNPKSLRTKFTLHFLKALKKINETTHQSQSQDYSNNNNNNNNNNNLIVAKKCRKIKWAANAALATAVGPGRAWTRAVLLRPGLHGRAVGRRRRRRVRARVVGPAEEEEELRRVVPGGEAMDDMECLLGEALHYVMCLTTQVNVMRSIVDLYSTTTTTTTTTS